MQRAWVLDLVTKQKEAREQLLQVLQHRPRIRSSSLALDVVNAMERQSGRAPVTAWLASLGLSKDALPSHLALIPDGNRRFAKARGQSVGWGYHMGSLQLEAFRQWAMVELGINTATIWALSTENIVRRPQEEMGQLFDVMAQFFSRQADLDVVHDNRIRHEVRGHMDLLPDRVQDSIRTMEDATRSYEDKVIIFLIPYSGRDELVRAAMQSVSAETQHAGLVTRITDTGEHHEEFREQLMLGDLPDPDLLIRTSEQRLSNMMLWHIAYTEFVFLQKMWPSFGRADLMLALAEFARRKRRFGV